MKQSNETPDYPILMRPKLVLQSLRGIKLQTRRLDKTWMKVKKGDNIWVRETWWTEKRFDEIPPRDVPESATIWWSTGHGIPKLPTNFDQDPIPRVKGKTRTSIHMPRWCSRLQLVATADAYLERLQDITDEDAIKEGVTLIGTTRYHGKAIDAFMRLWNEIHAKDGLPWSKNPELVVLNFKRLEDAR